MGVKVKKQNNAMKTSNSSLFVDVGVRESDVPSCAVTVVVEPTSENEVCGDTKEDTRVANEEI